MLQEELLKKVRYIELKVRKKVDSYLQGAYHTLFKGTGLEFQEVREYQEGDDARMMDWNVTARMGKPFIRLYREERELTVMLVVDISGSTVYGGSYSAREVMATLAAAIAFSAIKNNDKVGLLLFSDKVEQYIPPRRGRNNLLTVIRALLTASPQGTKTDPEQAFYFLNKVVKKKTLVFFISDMFFETMPQAMNITQRRHEVIPVAVYNRAHFEPAKESFVRVRDPESGETKILDFSEAREVFWNKFRQDKDDKFRRLRMRPIWVENKDDFINDLILGFKKMERGRRT